MRLLVPLILSTCWFIPANAAIGESRPNVLFIVIDDLNDWVGHLDGHRNTVTPNIDRLAAAGVSFLDAHASSPLCGPSRASFLSGISAATSGFHDNKSRFTDHPVLMKHDNLPQFFAAQGYGTFGAGKIFHYSYPEFWDEYLERGPRMYRSGNPKVNGYEIPGIMDWGPIDLEEEEMDDYRMAQFAIDHLDQKYEDPFFLACGIYLPHLPWYAPRKFFEPFPLDEVLLPVTNPNDQDDMPVRGRAMIENSYQEVVQALGEDAHREAVQAYLASSHFADAQVGRILDALNNSPYADNTIVVLFSDHGNHLGEKGKWHKDTLWSESTRVPLIIYAPGMAGNGSQVKAPVSLLDIYPTLVELVGAKVPDFLEGRSLVPLLEDPDHPWPNAAETHRRPGQKAIRTPEWTYIYYDEGGDELYDRRQDPSEWVNLSELSGYEAVKTELKAKE